MVDFFFLILVIKFFKGYKIKPATIIKKIITYNIPCPIKGINGASPKYA